MYGVLDFYRAARDADVKPVIGTEAYFVTTSRFDRPRRAEHEIFHLTLLATSNEGYHNLMKLSSAAYLDGYFYKPRMDFELLEQPRRGDRRDERVPGERRVPGAGSRRLHGGTRPRGAVPRRARARLVLHRAPGPRARGAAACEPRAASHRPGARDRPAGDERQSLHEPCRRRGARRAPVRADGPHARRPEPSAVRERGVLPEDGGRDAPSLP